MTVNDASLGESGSKLSKVAATSLLMGVTRASSEAYIDAGRTTMPKHPETDDSQNSILSYRFPESRHFHAAAKTTAMQTARNPP